MKLTLLATALVFFSSILNPDNQFETITFVNPDGVKISADLYLASASSDFIILLHQDRSSRGEYREIAKQLLIMGYNCLAVDLRSGESSNDVKNLTMAEALKKGKTTRLLDSKSDIETAISYVFQNYDNKPILLGSKFSASLAMMVGKDNKNVKAVVAFSPGEYFKSEKVNFVESVKGLDKPTFIAGSASETSSIEVYSEYVLNDNKMLFIPNDEEGAKGSQALLLEVPSQNKYWAALEEFLKSL
ncbi:MAG: hypothetical protein HKN22_07975 [Bacteroidia bacterium]|nr:hypothetical protein [Bacteroidia bacterium]